MNQLQLETVRDLFWIFTDLYTFAYAVWRERAD